MHMKVLCIKYTTLSFATNKDITSKPRFTSFKFSLVPFENDFFTCFDSFLLFIQSANVPLGYQGQQRLSLVH